MTKLTILLQADTAMQMAAAEATEPKEISLFYLLQEGGVLMIPLLICSLLLVYVFVERLLAIRKVSKQDTSFMFRIRDHISSGN